MSMVVFRRAPFSAWLALAAFLALTVFAVIRTKTDAERDAVAEFSYAADQILLKIEERFASYNLILRGGAGLFTASESVSREDWGDYFEKLAPDRNLPEVQGLGFSKVISPDHLAQHIADVRAEGFPEYTVAPAGERDIYTSIVYLEPFSDRNLRAFGYDMFTEPVRRLAMEQARDTGMAAISGKVQLLQESNADVQPGFLMYVPVYRKDMPTDTLERRREALIGWAYSPYRMNDLMTGLLSDWQHRLGSEISLHIYDGLQETPDALLFDSTTGPHTDTPRTIFYQQRTLDFQDHQWLLTFDQAGSPASKINYTATWTALVGGLLISALVFWLLAALKNTQTHAKRIADRLTHDIKAREQQLKESEARWKSAIEGSGLGVWDWDIPSRTVVFSKLWKEMLGYTADEIGASLDEWEKRVHPDDKPSAFAAVQDYLDGKSTTYDCDHRVLCKDGSYKWVRDRGMAFSRTEDGRPLRLIGTHSDITDRKNAEARILSLTRLYAALSASNAAIVRCNSQEDLFNTICRVVVEHGGMTLAWIGTIDETTGDITPSTFYGDGAEYLEGIRVSALSNSPYGKGPTGIAARENKPVWLDDFRKDARTAPWHERAVRFGWVSSAAIPICREGKPVAALTFYSRELNFFDDEKRKLLEEMANALSFALDKMDVEFRAMTYQTFIAESESQFRGMIEQTFSGVYVTQNSRVVYANPRFCEIIGWESDELLGRDTTEFFGDKNKAQILEARERLNLGEPSVELVLPFRSKDGKDIILGLHGTRGLWKGQSGLIVMAQDITERKRSEEKISAYVKQLEGSMHGTLTAISNMVEIRDPYTAGHERRVGIIAADLAREMGWAEERCRNLELIGLVHDIGKIGIPAEILTKPTRLTPLEMEIIKTHAQNGYEILKGTEFPLPIAEIIWQHHERMDGSGYPQGLRGENILPEARVIAVADVLESMASHRPYRPARGLDVAIAEIKSHRGTWFDSAVVDAMEKLIQDKGYKLPT